jgi:hypothetical protein
MPAGLVPREDTVSTSAESVAETVDALKIGHAERRARPTTPDPLASWARASADGSTIMFPCPVDALVDDLRLERYHNRNTPRDSPLSSIVKSAYYLVRPLLPVGVRKHLQRSWLKDWRSIPFPEWPVDTTVEAILTAVLTAVLKERGGEIPFIWFWPNGHDACAIMTHDVETAVGRDFCGKVMDIEAPFGIASAFEVVPEQRYEVTENYLASIRARGCEICIHDLNHDGRLFSREDLLIERAKKINDYAIQYGAIGFRSAVMYRNVDWFRHFSFKYDMSMPNVAHLDPQRGGCCTVMPYTIGNLLELPLTTIQDYPLFHNLEQYDTGLWKDQIAIVRRNHGLISFIVHPDYIVSARAQDVYRRLLGMLAELRDVSHVWTALPRDVYGWWMQRSAMRLAGGPAAWRIEGEGSERASIGWLRLEGEKLAYRR